MATGKKAKDLFSRTITKPANIGLEVTPRFKGRPQAAEPYRKVTVCLFDRHVIHLDKVALAIRERTGRMVKRAELIRAIVDYTARTVNPEKLGADFDRAVRDMFPQVRG